MPEHAIHTLPTPERLIAQLIEQITPTLGTQGWHGVALVGMHTGGVWVMQNMLQQLAAQISEPGRIDHGTVDTSFYRDDYAQRGLHDGVKPSRLDFDIEGRHILLLDDILNTGRSSRAAVNLLFDYGRPASIRLAVLVDRGGRELPVCAGFAGIRLDLPANQRINLARAEDETLSLVISEKNTEKPA